MDLYSVQRIWISEMILQIQKKKKKKRGRRGGKGVMMHRDDGNVSNHLVLILLLPDWAASLLLLLHACFFFFFFSFKTYIPGLHGWWRVAILKNCSSVNVYVEPTPLTFFNSHFERLFIYPRAFIPAIFISSAQQKKKMKGRVNWFLIFFSFSLFFSPLPCKREYIHTTH